MLGESVRHVVEPLDILRGAGQSNRQLPLIATFIVMVFSCGLANAYASPFSSFFSAALVASAPLKRRQCVAARALAFQETNSRPPAAAIRNGLGLSNANSARAPPLLEKIPVGFGNHKLTPRSVIPKVRAQRERKVEHGAWYPRSAVSDDSC